MKKQNRSTPTTKRKKVIARKPKNSLVKALAKKHAPIFNTDRRVK